MPWLHSGTAQSNHSEARFIHSSSAPVRWGSSTWRLSCENGAIFSCQDGRVHLQAQPPCRPRPHTRPQHKHPDHHRRREELSIFFLSTPASSSSHNHPAPHTGCDDQDSRRSLSPGKHSALCHAALCNPPFLSSFCPTSATRPNAWQRIRPGCSGCSQPAVYWYRLFPSSSHRSSVHPPPHLSFHIVIVMGIVDMSGPVHLLVDLSEDPAFR